LIASLRRFEWAPSKYNSPLERVYLIIILVNGKIVLYSHIQAITGLLPLTVEKA
jgi:hypothetical protein